MHPDAPPVEARRGVVEIEVAGERIALFAERAALWISARTLIISDLHIGKEETFLEFGIPMPRTVLDETLARLDALVTITGATRVLVVGDLVHSRRGMTQHVVDRVAAWRERFGGLLELALGNHDQRVELPDEWRVRVRWPDERDGSFAFSHEPCERPARDAYTWCGHLHPTVRLERRFDAIVLPCFAIGARQAILPAFTAFSRGLAVESEPGMRRFAIAQGEVVEVAG